MSVALCNVCGTKSETTDSRERRDGYRRRRRCPTCGRKWTTIEVRVDDIIPSTKMTKIKSILAELNEALAIPTEEATDDE